MDIITRGAIEALINYVYQSQNMLETIDWIIEIDRELKSLNDFALGYFLGSLMSKSSELANQLKTAKKFEVRFKKYRKELEKNPKKRMRKVTTKLTEEETEEIRDIIKGWLNRFREKLNREIDVRRTDQ